MFDNSEARKSTDMHNYLRDCDYGFDKEARKKKIRWLLFVILLNTGLLVNCCLVIWNCYKLQEKKIPNSHLEMLMFLFFCFNFVFLIRIMKSFYLLMQWKNLNTNPTVIESKIEYYC